MKEEILACYVHNCKTQKEINCKSEKKSYINITTLTLCLYDIVIILQTNTNFY